LQLAFSVTFIFDEIGLRNIKDTNDWLFIAVMTAQGY